MRVKAWIITVAMAGVSLQVPVAKSQFILNGPGWQAVPAVADCEEKLSAAIKSKLTALWKCSLESGRRRGRRLHAGCAGSTVATDGAQIVSP